MSSQTKVNKRNQRIFYQDEFKTQQSSKQTNHNSQHKEQITHVHNIPHLAM